MRQGTERMTIRLMKILFQRKISNHEIPYNRQIIIREED